MMRGGVLTLDYLGQGARLGLKWGSLHHVGLLSAEG